MQVPLAKQWIAEEKSVIGGASEGELPNNRLIPPPQGCFRRRDFAKKVAARGKGFAKVSTGLPRIATVKG
ncbi:MAG: hypothetical protein ACR5LG_08115 [Sodalis sp. (in: enterobacteria)]